MYRQASPVTESADRLLTAREACQYLRVSLFTLRRIEQQQLITPFRTPGGHRRYSVAMLNTYLENSRGHRRGQGGGNGQASHGLR